MHRLKGIVVFELKISHILFEVESNIVISKLLSITTILTIKFGEKNELTRILRLLIYFYKIVS